MSERSLSVFRRLSAAFSPTGCERLRTAVISDILSEAGIDYSLDRRGNATAVLHGRESGSVTVFVTHIDSHGMMVTSVEDGAAAFEPVADIETDTLYGKHVLVGRGERLYPGVISAVPLHLTAKKDALKRPDYGDMFIDTGTSAIGGAERKAGSDTGMQPAPACDGPGGAADTCGDNILPGDYVAIAPYDAVLGDRLLISSSAEACSAAAAMLSVLIGLSAEGFRPSHDICFVFAVGGKSAAPGAVSAMRALSPSSIIFVSSVPADKPDAGIILPCKVGRAVCSPKLRAGLVAAADRIDLPCRVTADTCASVPLRALQTLGAGCDAAVIGIPTEMQNAARQLCLLESIDSAAALISAIAESDML